MSEPRRHKASSDFSIDRILAADPPKTDVSDVRCPEVAQRLAADGYQDSTYADKSGKMFLWVNSGLEPQWKEASPCPRVDLPWLRCTRYKPPKLPRKPSNGKSTKRRLGSHPRIPFTKFQLEILEEKYKNGAYLTRKDVVHLSGVLHLPQSRIKIWFQNRRARERKESRSIELREGTSEPKVLNND